LTFDNDPIKRKAYLDANRDRINAWHRDNYARNKPRFLAKQRKYYEEHKDKQRIWQSKYYLTHKDEATQRYWANRDRELARGLKNKMEYKTTVMEHYSKTSPPSCQRCGYFDLRALSIDHINGGGTKHRKEVRALYYWLIKNNFPEGFQVLCMNCQFIKRAERKEFGGLGKRAKGNESAD
jgi:hypothetical protein